MNIESRVKQTDDNMICTGVLNTNCLHQHSTINWDASPFLCAFLILPSLWIKAFLKQFGFGCLEMSGGETTIQMDTACTLRETDRWQRVPSERNSEY